MKEHEPTMKSIDDARTATRKIHGETFKRKKNGSKRKRAGINPRVQIDVRAIQSEAGPGFTLDLVELLRRYSNSSAASLALDKIHKLHQVGNCVSLDFVGAVDVTCVTHHGTQEVDFSSVSTPESRRRARMDLRNMSDAEYCDAMRYLCEQADRQESQRAMRDAEREERRLGQQIVAAYGDSAFGYTHLARHRQRGRLADVEDLRQSMGDAWISEMLLKYQRDTGVGYKRFRDR